MINVKYLTQNWSRSNNIYYTLHLNYFQRKKLWMLASTKAQFILQKLVPQIQLFWNYEKFIHAYLKSRETENYLKIEENLYKCMPK